MIEQALAGLPSFGVAPAACLASEKQADLQLRQQLLRGLEMAQKVHCDGSVVEPVGDLGSDEVATAVHLIQQFGESVEKLVGVD